MLERRSFAAAAATADRIRKRVKNVRSFSFNFFSSAHWPNTAKNDRRRRRRYANDRRRRRCRGQILAASGVNEAPHVAAAAVAAATGFRRRSNV